MGDIKNKMNIRKRVITILVLTLPLVSVLAQTEATTKEGKKVILYEDGTWKYDDIETETKIIVNYECSDLTYTRTSETTGKSTTSAKKLLIVSDNNGKTGFGIFVINDQQSTILKLHIVGAGDCITDNDKMIVHFRDGTELELINDGEANCDPQFTLYINGVLGKQKEIDFFWTKEVETMRVWTSDGYVEQNFSDQQSYILHKTIDCLINMGN